MTRRLRVLHLAFQDPRRPGSGGGAVRTREIGRRLAQRHEVTVLTAGWPGARPRDEEGVRWRHTPALPGRAAAAPYFPGALLAARSWAADLVVEDFAAPVSTLGVPRWTPRPVVGVVQWLFAAQKAQQYHLPFDRVEAWGLRQHTTLVAVSEELGEQLRARAPGARVHVVPNGVEPQHPHPGPRAGAHGQDLVFLGRLENAQKGLDVLLRALADPLMARRGSWRLLVAGDGPDEDALRALAGRLGVAARVQWLGRVEGAAKQALLRDAAAVVVPSRYETFGMVAAEAMAAGAPVVASDVPCLREVASAGVLVPPDDPGALAAAVAGVLDDPGRARDMGRRGRLASVRYDWDRLAEAQEAVYLEAVARHRQR